MLRLKVRRSLAIIRYVTKRASLPLIVNFSGGKDSAVLLDLVQRETDDFLCIYCVSSIDFPEAREYAEQSAERRGIDLYLSYPSFHRGDFFENLARRGYFPTPRVHWCGSYLKWRPQKKLLIAMFGKRILYKLNAVRKHESTRREAIYKAGDYILKDFDVANDFIVFPILDWTTKERDQYIAERKLRIDTNPLYKKYGVSGCYWCPFYQPSIYERILKDKPDLYDRFIEWEIKLNKPSVIGHIWLRDLKKQVSGRHLHDNLGPELSPVIRTDQSSLSLG